jgi:ABC-type transport system involved in cytochrome bd biosynthesis fused ATPase/permease subunit
VGVRLAEGGLGFEAALTILVLAPELYLPLRNLAAQWHASADGAAVAGRLLDLVEGPQTASDNLSQAPVERAQPPDWSRIWPVRFEQVSFRYPSREDDALRGVDLELQSGETVALVGPSGGGKSTLLALLLRFAEPVSGSVVVGDGDLAAVDPRAWRSGIAWVPQRPTLVRGTVADNIRLGDRSADADRVAEAARLAGADTFVERLPAGYGTVVGDGGRRLSAGEVRRIALARAFVRDAPLVLLDEPTADLDPENAALVADAVERLRVGRTVLIVAHRPELASLADRVIRLEGGRIVEGAAA